jgi:hypothetical protein
MHCNVDGRPCRVGRSIRLLALRSYVLKFNPTIDEIHQQPNENMEVIKVALEAKFDYLDHPLAYENVED